jgi:dihydrolipoamide dehydrogenase
MTNQACDLMVLGSGPGGYVAAIRASQLGRNVTIVERDSLGGICLNWGCIPSKALLKSAQVCWEIKHAESFGLQTGPLKIDFPKVIERSRGVADKLSGGVTYLMKKNKVTVVKGNGKIEKGNKLLVTGADGKQTTYTYKDLIIATGARARPFPGLEVDGEVIHTYRTILENRRHPQKLLIVGGGVIGIEFAYFFNSMGVQVTVVEMLDQILPFEDTEVAKELEKILKKQGINIVTSASIKDLKRNGKTASATISGQGQEEKWTGDCCLVSIGVIPNTDNIGLEAAGIRVDRGLIQVDEFMRASVPNHFAIGDIVRGPQLAHKASHEGLVAAEAACGKAHHGMRYDNIPSCIYCQPQVASIGMTEKAAKEKGLKYKVGKIPFSAIGKAIAIGEADGFIKVIIDQDTGEVYGVHIIHAEATELITEAIVIRTHEGIAASVLDTIHPHPTLSESMAEAMALAMGRPINF